MKAASETSYTLRNTEKAFFTRTTLTFRKNRSSSHNFSFFSSISIMPLLSSPTAQRVRLYFNVLRTRRSFAAGRAGGGCGLLGSCASFLAYLCNNRRETVSSSSDVSVKYKDSQNVSPCLIIR